MTTNVRIKFKDKNKIVSKEKVCEIAYGKLNIPFVRLFPTNDGYKAICRNDMEADKVLCAEARKTFEKEGLLVMMPPDMRAKRTVFVRKLDQQVGKHTADEIQTEVEDKNEHLKVAEITKIKDYTHVIKIRFEETQMADKVIQRGFLAFNMSITPDQIEKETFVSLLTCFNCYQMEDHTTKNCKENNKILCSECTEENHKWTECKSQVKACLNCKRNGRKDYNTHRTLAMACPYKKQLIKDKKEEEKNKIIRKQQETYSEIANKAAAAAKKPEVNTELKLSEVKHYKILISIIHAHIMNVCNPGTYKEELNKMLKHNNLEEMWFPENPDSSRLLSATGENDLEMQIDIPAQTYSNEESSEEEEEEYIAETIEVVSRDPRLRYRQEKTEKQTNKEHRTEKHESKETAVKPKRQEINPEYGREIGLKIYVNGQIPYPTKEPNQEEIITGINQGKYKWTYENSLYTEDYIMTLIENHAIKIQKNDFKRIDEAHFIKIINGLQEYSPSKQQRKNRKK